MYINLLEFVNLFDKIPTLFNDQLLHKNCQKVQLSIQVSTVFGCLGEGLEELEMY